MDPNKLSMEEGKQFLKQCGIPQRDIDLMTEKWVVVASVEVLLRFPLLPGEDPTARCVSNKNSQTSVPRPNPVPQNLEDQEKRKYNNQLKKNFDKKPNVKKQMTDHHIQPPAERPPGDKTQKKKCFGTVRPKTPREEEEETKVTCKNCGAFGHTARSKMCPMKRWAEALPVQPLGSNKKKEKTETMTAEQLQTPGIFKKTDKEEKERQMQELLPRKILPQKFPTHSTEKKRNSLEEPESCFFLRKPTRPSLICMTKKKTSLGPVSNGLPLCKTPNVRATTSSCSYKKGQENTYGLVPAHDMGFSDTLKSNCGDRQDSSPSSMLTSRGAVVSPKCALEPDVKTAVSVHDIKLQTNKKHHGTPSTSCVQSMRPKYGQDSEGRIQAPGKKPLQITSRESQHHPKKRRISSCLNPTMRTLVSELEDVQISQPSLSTNACQSSRHPR
ncbi:protein FAM90A27P-like [Phodopus roborovskii]|uniref:protein FAM90A27P-like n=1 Tax=Phodopus roborovskii TaxID=109678 RepID=UPI0021E4BF67|nr:protein FAM90A27P-like [Phodopus roborovskii]